MDCSCSARETPSEMTWWCVAGQYTCERLTRNITGPGMTAELEIPKGTKPIYRALRDAGIGDASPQRNIQWIRQAYDGVWVLNLWRRYIDDIDGQVVAELDAREWSSRGISQAKTLEVIERLSELSGQQIRVVVLEENVVGSRKSSGAQLDSATWLVEDTGADFVLWRGRTTFPHGSVPANPLAYGKLNPQRKSRVSLAIERDGRVRALTLSRARYRCEMPGCTD